MMMARLSSRGSEIEAELAPKLVVSDVLSALRLSLIAGRNIIEFFGCRYQPIEGIGIHDHARSPPIAREIHRLTLCPVDESTKLIA